MRLILVSDLHGYSKTLDYLNRMLDQEKPDGVIISGDLSMNSDTEFLLKLFAILHKYKVRGYIICGNADEGAAAKLIDESEFSINQKCRDGICGLCDHEEALVDPGLIAGNIFVTHRPPAGVMLNRPLNNAPKIHISGHLHSRSSAKQYPATFMIQVPTLQNGEYAVFITDNKTVEYKSLIANDL